MTRIAREDHNINLNFVEGLNSSQLKNYQSMFY